jgi:hypothetical protein
MLNKFYCLEEYDESNTARTLPGGIENVIVTHFVDLEKPAALPALLRHQYSSQGNYPFSLAIGNFSPDKAEKLGDILTFFFHPYYYTHFYGKVLFVYGDYPDEQASLVLLSEHFSRQLIEVRLIRPGHRPDEGSPERLVRVGKDAIQEEAEWEDLGSYYYNYCSAAYDSDDLFLLAPAHERTVESIEKEIRTVYARLQNETPRLSVALSQNAAMKKEIIDLAKVNRQLKEEKQILNTLLDMSSQHNEVNYILNFYKNEYEILPLWFKRLGHIIKVFMGKRTFKSLFDDNVKRHNN